MNNRVIFIASLLILMIVTIVQLYMFKNDIVLLCIIISRVFIVGLHGWLCIKEVLFLARHDNIKIIENYKIRIYVTALFFIEVFWKLIFPENVGFYAGIFANNLFFIYLLYDTILVGDTEIFYNGKKIILDDSLVLTIKEVKSNYSILNVNGKYRLSVKDNYLDYFKKFINTNY